VVQDKDKAVEWYMKAAEQGYANAQNNVGECYFNSVGAVMDKTKAIKWFTKAAEQGHAKAQNNLGDFCNDCPNLHINVNLSLSLRALSGYNPNRYPGPELQH